MQLPMRLFVTGGAVKRATHIVTITIRYETAAYQTALCQRMKNCRARSAGACSPQTGACGCESFHRSFRWASKAHCNCRPTTAHNEQSLVCCKSLVTVSESAVRHPASYGST